MVTDSQPKNKPAIPAMGPLSRVHVVDFTHVLAGPACAYYLGLLGAEVIKVESLVKGDSMRHRGGTDRSRSKDAMSTAYMTQGAGKRSIALDLETKQGREIMERLLEQADVFVENHRPVTLREIGLAEDDVLARHPKLIYCAMSGYGRGSEFENAPAYDVNIQATCGLMTMTGTPEAGPTRTGAPVMDYSTALAAGFAISTALYQRERTGLGTFIDVSMLETAYALMSSAITDYSATGNEPKQRGNAANGRSPGAGSFECRSGMISLGVNEEHQFRALANVLKCDHWLTDPKFADPEKRREHETELVEEMSKRLAEKSADVWEEEMLASDVPAAKVRTLVESLAMSSEFGRSFLYEDLAATMTYPTLPFRLGEEAANKPSCSPPRHGEDTGHILSNLGYDEAQIEALRNDDVVA